MARRCGKLVLRFAYLDGLGGANAQTIITAHTAAQVDLFLIDINAASLAHALAASTMDASLGREAETKERKTGQ